MPAHELSDERSPHEPPRRSRRRRFTPEYKLFIVREAAACTKKGELGALLRREGLYPSHLAAFRSAASRSMSGSFATEARTPRRRSVQALQLQLAQKDRELARWRKRAERAEAMVRFQKKTFNLTRYSPAERNAVLELIAELSRLVGVAPACDALALPRATYYRRLRARDAGDHP